MERRRRMTMKVLVGQSLIQSLIQMQTIQMMSSLCEGYTDHTFGLVRVAIRFNGGKQY